ncbi:MAG: OmpH family outer membrane protein [Akkermansiaceae bacterium]
MAVSLYMPSLMMHKIATVFFGLALITASAGAAEIKVASVNIDQLLLHYRKAENELSRLKAGHDRYLTGRNSKQKQINQLAIDIKAIYAKLRNKAMPRSERNHLVQQQRDLINQYETLAKEIEEADKEQLAATKRKIASATERILETCHHTISSYAKKNGYQWVMETSGSTSSQVSALVYARETVDITGDILTLLNESTSP